MTFTFDSSDDVKLADGIMKALCVGLLADTNVSTIYSLYTKIKDLIQENRTTLDLSETEAKGLLSICQVYSKIEADECSLAFDMCRSLRTLLGSDVPRFIAALKDLHLERFIIDSYCKQLFKDWCSQEGEYVRAYDCLMLINNTGDKDWLKMFNWCNDNDPKLETDCEEEVKLFEEKVNELCE